MKYDRQKIYDKCGGHCSYCGIEIAMKDMQVDHIIPQSNYDWGFRNDGLMKEDIPEFLRHLTPKDVNHIDNLMPSCRSCNGYKSTYHLEMFRKQLGLLVNRLNERSTIYKISKRYGTIIETNKPIQFYFETL